MPARLTIIHEQDASRVYRLEDSRPTVLGRSTKTDIRVPDGKASRNHCRIECVGSHWTLTDLDSLNGTHVNDERITTTRLASGDTIRIGSAVYKLTIDGEPESNPDVTELVAVERDQETPQRKDSEIRFAPAAEEDRAAEPEEEAPACAQCGRRLSRADIAAGKVTEIGGRLFCSRCVVLHSETGSADQKQPSDAEENSEFGSLLKSLERATAADRAEPGQPPQSHEPGQQRKRRGLLGRFRRKKPGE